LSDEEDNSDEPVSNQTPIPNIPIVDQGPLGRDWGLVTPSASIGNARGFVPLVFQNKLWIVSSESGKSVWCSTDGSQWTETAEEYGLNAPGGCGAEVFRGRLWVAGGNGYVADSQDGIHWDIITHTAPFGVRYQTTLTTFNNQLWLIGGVHGSPANDVWCSSDGKEWKCILEAAPFPGRRAHQTVVFNGKLWVIGGIHDSVYTPMDDIWYSSDSSHWQQSNAGPHFEGRHSLGVVVDQGKLWVISGDNGQRWGGVNDVWNTFDGVHWNCLNHSAAFGGRIHAATAAYKGRIWLMGGDHSSVWCSPPL
jgi:hypothetical protein